MPVNNSLRTDGGCRSRSRSQRIFSQTFNGIGLCAGLSVLLAGCASSPSIYYWGHYEDLVYTAYAEPGKADPIFQIEQLEADYEVARSRNLRVPPGFHAHLGVQYFQTGKPDLARREFLAEKSQFPESAVFMDRLLTQLPQ